LHWHYAKVLDGHPWAACAMFAFLAIAALIDCGFGLVLGHTGRVYAILYGIVGTAMLVFGVGFIILHAHSRSSFGGHLVLLIEAVEIFLFVVFWVIQTIERWDQTV
jgi:hypothetical protein